MDQVVDGPVCIVLAILFREPGRPHVRRSRVLHFRGRQRLEAASRSSVYFSAGGASLPRSLRVAKSPATKAFSGVEVAGFPARARFPAVPGRGEPLRIPRGLSVARCQSVVLCSRPPQYSRRRRIASEMPGSPSAASAYSLCMRRTPRRSAPRRPETSRKSSGRLAVSAGMRRRRITALKHRTNRRQSPIQKQRRRRIVCPGREVSFGPLPWVAARDPRNARSSRVLESCVLPPLSCSGSFLAPPLPARRVLGFASRGVPWCFIEPPRSGASSRVPPFPDGFFSSVPRERRRITVRPGRPGNRVHRWRDLTSAGASSRRLAPAPEPEPPPARPLRRREKTSLRLWTCLGGGPGARAIPPRVLLPPGSFPPGGPN